MRNEYRRAASCGRRQTGPCNVLCALLILIATTACSANGPTPQTSPTPQLSPSPAVVASPTAATAVPAYSNSRVIEKYRQLLPQIMKENNIPGLSLAVVDDKQVLWAEGFGVTDPAQNRPVTADTLFSVQSMSKNFTAIAVLMAAQDGLVDVNAPISTYLPDFRVNSIFDEHPEQKMTLTNLLGHTAGFTHEAPVGNNVDIGPATFEEHIKSISNTWLMYPVGQAYNYSNNGPDLAGYILQVRSGMTFEQYMQEKLLDPIGMTHSTFDLTRIQQVEDRAIGHDQRVATIPVAVPMIPAGGLYTSAADMAKYLQFHINLGVVAAGTDTRSASTSTQNGWAGKRLVPESLLDTIYAPPSPITRQRGEGYGVFVGRKHDTYYIGSGGGGFGFLSDLLWYPELKLGIVLLTNSVDHNLHAALDGQILDDLITDPDTIFYARYMHVNGTTLAPWEKVRGAFVSPQPTPDVSTLIKGLAPTPTAQDKLRWAQYVGTYGVKVWGQVLLTLQLYEQDSRLYANYLGSTAPLTEVRPGVFYLDSGEAIDLRGPIPVVAGTRVTRVANGLPEGAPTGTP
jgi:CubicO group peptidase (beta-lactamase class C family)